MLVVLSGPSGVGKDSLLQELRSRITDIHFAVSMTTRAPRPGEQQGTSYFFVSQQEYQERLGVGELLAPAQVHGNWYGVPVDQVRKVLHAGQDVLLKIDVQGGIQLRRRVPQAVFIFLAPQSMDDLTHRIAARHTESEQELELRMHDAHFEMEQLPSYDYCIVNRQGGLTDAADGVACVIRAERMRIHRQPIDL